jgi:Thiol-disulfide isomerase and thioredoxins
MKNKNVQIFIALILVASIGLNIYQFIQEKNLKTETQTLQAKVDEYGTLYTPIYQHFTSLTVQDFKDKVASGEKFTVYIGRPDCSDCNTFEPTLEEIISEQHLESKLNYLNVKWLRESDKEIWQTFKDTYGFTQTPAFITFENGKQKDMIEWTDKGLPKSELVTWLGKQKIN